MHFFLKNKQKFIFNLFALFLLAFFSFIFSINFALAQDVSTSLDTKTNTVNIGDTVSVKLNVNPQTGSPVFTVSTLLKYDPEMLEILDSKYSKDWVSLSLPEFSSIDRNNGIILRTAGLPNGLSNSKEFVTYNFKTLKKGETTIKIINGSAYNENNTDVGVDRSDLNIQIKDQNLENQKTLTLISDLNIKGDTAFYKQNPYAFDIYNKKQDIDQLAITKIWVFDGKDNLYYDEEQLWHTGIDTILEFTIPENTLEEGSYTIIVKTRYEDEHEEEVLRKNIGVLSNGQTWFTKNQVPFMSVFFVIIFASLLHHFATDLNLYDKLNSLRRKKKKNSKTKNAR